MKFLDYSGQVRTFRFRMSRSWHEEPSIITERFYFVMGFIHGSHTIHVIHGSHGGQGEVLQIFLMTAMRRSVIIEINKSFYFLRVTDQLFETNRSFYFLE